MKVLEYEPDKDKKNDRKTTKLDMKEMYKQQELENQRKIYGEGMHPRGHTTVEKQSNMPAQDRVNELKDQMSKNLNALNERGDRIEELQDKR